MASLLSHVAHQKGLQKIKQLESKLLKSIKKCEVIMKCEWTDAQMENTHLTKDVGEESDKAKLESAQRNQESS
uniref:Uncharacterized protein n=1 Tax=Cannabis sativa TaxID=3483 RepID=A0A803PKP3_CANSA